MKRQPTSPTASEWKPRRAALLLAIVVQLGFVCLAFWYSGRLAPPPAVTPKLVPEVLTPEDVIFSDSDIGARKGKKLPPVDVPKAATPTSAQIQAGGRLFAEHCTSCHGVGGKGDGAAGRVLNPPPRDLTSLQGWKKGARLSDLFRTLTQGLEGTAMPAFDYLTPEQRFALGHFVRTLASGHAQDTPDSLAALDRDFELSAGAQEPNIVPVDTAMERLLEQQKSPAPVSGIGGADSSMAIFKTVTDPNGRERLARLLSSDGAWRQDLNRLKSIAGANPPTNGFLPAVRLLTEADWAELQLFLKQTYPETRGEGTTVAALTTRSQ